MNRNEPVLVPHGFLHDVHHGEKDARLSDPLPEFEPMIPHRGRGDPHLAPDVVVRIPLERQRHHPLLDVGQSDVPFAEFQQRPPRASVRVRHMLPRGAGCFEKTGPVRIDAPDFIDGVAKKTPVRSRFPVMNHPGTKLVDRRLQE